jgi:AcrR family transcriptional regulator
MTNPMVARPVDTDMPAQIVAHATRLFAAQGFDGTALQQIADAVGVTKPAVLHHFPSKEHVRLAVLDAIVAHWNDALPRLLLASHSAHDRFEAVFGELLAFFGEHPDRARVVLREVLDRPADIRKILRGAIRPWLEALAEGIRAGQRERRYRDDVDADAYVAHMIQLVIAASAAASVGATAIPSGPIAGGAGAGGGDGEDRYHRELARIARASLLTDSYADVMNGRSGDATRARKGAKGTWPASSPTTKTSSSTSTKRSTGPRSPR